METAINAGAVIDNTLGLELFSDNLILNYDPLVEHFKSRQEAFKRKNPFYTDIYYDDEMHESVSVKETDDSRVFLVKMRVASHTGKDGSVQLEESVITEFDKGELTDYALIEKAKEIWNQQK